MASQPMQIVFLLDVDNTLLNNDSVTADLKSFLIDTFGAERQERYWTILDNLRNELGYTDYLGALQRYRIENPRDPNFIHVSYYLLKYPFANRLSPNAIRVIEYLKRWGQTVILSDGDVVFQPYKIDRSGLYDAVDKQALIYIHKEELLDEVERRYPAEHYVLVDDKLRILNAIKNIWKYRLTTVFPKQGHYANDPQILSAYPKADITIQSIGDLLDFDLTTLLNAASMGFLKNC